MINYEMFEKTIEAMKNFQKEMEPYYLMLCAEGPWDKLYAQTIELVAHGLCEGTNLDYDTVLDDVEYFIHECYFGDDWFKGMITDGEENPVDWSSIKKFYDYQVKEAEEAK